MVEGTTNYDILFLKNFPYVIACNDPGSAVFLLKTKGSPISLLNSVASFINSRKNVCEMIR